MTNCDNTIILIIPAHCHLQRNTQGYRHLTSTEVFLETTRQLMSCPTSISQLSWPVLDSHTLSPMEWCNKWNYVTLTRRFISETFAPKPLRWSLHYLKDCWLFSTIKTTSAHVSWHELPARKPHTLSWKPLSPGRLFPFHQCCPTSSPEEPNKSKEIKMKWKF